MNLANKYRPKSFDEMCEQHVVVDIVKNICNSSELTCRNFLFIGPAGTGKAQPLSSKVLTVDGYVPMQDIQIGDKVFTANGNIGSVIGIYPQGDRPVYEITLQDRTKIRVSDEHLNICFRYNEDKKCREDFCLTTTELISLFQSSRFKLRMDVPSVDWDEVPVPMDPYLVGALLGDGSLSGNLQFCNSEEDVIQKVDEILRRDWNKMLRKCPGDNVDYDIVDVQHVDHKYTFYYKGVEYPTIAAMQSELVSEGYPMLDSDTIIRLANRTAFTTLRKYPELYDAISVEVDLRYRAPVDDDPFRVALSKLGMFKKSTEKHIPDVYLKNSRNVRMSLLRGLYDMDGYTDGAGLTTFTTCSDILSDDFEFLVRSLGIRDTVVSYPAKYKVGDDYVFTGSTAHDHNLKIPNHMNYCSSEKHKNRRTIRQNPPLRNIKSIEYVGHEACQCILIDHPDHTYISDDFIPTHNTTISRVIANVLNEGKGEPIEIDAASHSGVDSMRDIVNQAQQYPVGTNYKVFIIDEVHALSNAAWQSALKCLEEGPAKSVFLLCTTNPEKIPATILSRVQTFQLSKISLKGIHDRIVHVLDSEIAEGRKITYSDDAVNFIAKLANGGMRDALTLTDKALAYSENLTIENLSVALNLPNYDDYFTLLNCYARGDNAGIAKLIDEVYNSGVNFIKWFEGFHAFIMNVVKYIFLQDISLTMIPAYYLDKMANYGAAHSTVCLKLANKLITLIYELKSTQYLQEVALTHLCVVPRKDKK